MKRLAICFFFVSSLIAQPTCAIRGKVVDALSSQPVPRAQVFADLASEDADSGPPVRRIADAQGAFCFENLIAGRYFIHVKAASYIDTSYGEEKPGDEGKPIEVSPEPVAPPITIQVIPGAAISGTVTDEDGEPISGAYVTLFQREQETRPKLVQTAKTDDQGHYRLGGLLAGTYLIAATPNRRVLMSNGLNVLDENGRPHTKVQGRTFYKNAISIADAVPLLIKAGQQLTGLTLTIKTAATRHLSGKLAAELLNTNLRMLYLVQPSYGQISLTASVPVQEDGSFVVDGLFPGPYLLETGRVRQAIDLTNGDVDGLLVEFPKPVELRVKIHSGPDHLQIRRIAFLPQTGPPFAGQTAAEPQPDHTFKAILPADEYEIRVTANTPCVIDHILIDGVRQDGNLLTIKNGEPPKQIELFLSMVH